MTLPEKTEGVVGQIGTGDPSEGDGVGICEVTRMETVLRIKFFFRYHTRVSVLPVTDVKPLTTFCFEGPSGFLQCK